MKAMCSSSSNRERPHDRGADDVDGHEHGDGGGPAGGDDADTMKHQIEQKATKPTKGTETLRYLRLPLCLVLLAAAGTAGAATYTNLGLAIRLSSPSQVEIGWDTATNAAYRLEACTGLASHAWSPCTTDWLAGDGNRCCTNVALLADKARFYRVAVTNGPTEATPKPISWAKLFGGGNDDFANSVEPTSDGGYVVVGCSSSVDADSTGNHGGADGIVLRLDGSGNAQ